jgi:acyl-coenzyme A thioesterase PaaI-like protein
MNAPNVPPVLRAYRLAEKFPFGRSLFTRAFQRVAPYFRTIPVRIQSVEPGIAVVAMADRRSVRNHLGTVHAIALCNLAELTMGLVVEASLPRSHRWIPKGMSVQYLAKARGEMTATGTFDLPDPMPERGEMTVPVAVRNADGETVFHADILLWVTERQPAN